MRNGIAGVVLVLVALEWVSLGMAADELKCIQKPMFWLLGQQTRIVIETPGDCGKLDVKYPDALKLFDRWPHKTGDTIQRFYFRALQPLETGEILFSSGAYSLSLPVQVIPWEQALKPGSLEFEGRRVPLIFPMEGGDEHKSDISFLTRQQLDEMRAAGAGGPEAVAKTVAALPADEDVFSWLPETTLPRAVFVQRTSPKGCPICGRKIYEGRSPFYPWVFDYENHPYQVQCPECKRWFPDNNFAAGDMTNGQYPDDGWGYIDPQGDPYCFVSYYNCWHYLNRYIPLVDRYCDLYARTGNQRIGRTAALAMFRVAEQYLNLALNINQRKAYTREAVWRGKIIPQTGMKPYQTWFYVEDNWEVPRLTGYAKAFECIWDYFDTEDPEFIKFLQDNYHPEIRTMEDARSFIETGYFRVMAQGCLDGTIIGNHPQGQRCAMETALVLNTPRAREIVEWTFNQGGMRYFLTNEYFIDGAPFESPSYNRGHVTNLQAVADVLNRIVELRPEQYKDAKFPLLTKDPKYKTMYDFHVNYSMINRTWADVGDSGDVERTDARPLDICSSLGPEDYVAPFAVYPDCTNFARVLWDPNVSAPIPALRDERLRAQVEALIAREGAELQLPSNFLDGYGQATLRSGSGSDQRALWLRWGECYGHRHDDMLTMGFEAKQRTLLPELGYPHSWTFRVPWEGNRLTHYSAQIVGEDPAIRRIGGGVLELFADGGWAKMACVGTRAYRDVPAWRIYEMVPGPLMARSIALVDINERDSYGISILRLRGGTHHYVSFHGPRGSAAASGLQLVSQAAGTLAGPDVEYGKGDEWTKANPLLSAFPYMYDVRKASADRPWQMEWTLENYPDLHLRMYEVQPQPSDVSLAKGKPPGGGNPYQLQWVMQHRGGKEGLSSQFATVIEPYQGEPAISEVRHIHVSSDDQSDQPAVAFQVVLGDRVDTIIQCYDPSIPVRTGDGVEMLGFFGIWSEVNGRMDKAFLVNGTYISKGDARVEAEAASYTGRIVTANFPARKIVVEPTPTPPQLLVGRQLRITNEAGNDCSHLIVGARSVPDGVELTLELDPRIGEGPVTSVFASYIGCGADLIFGRWLYYHGKTLANEDGSATYKITGVSGNHNAFLDQTQHPGLTQEQHASEFVDKDGDGVARMLIYDYGPGDTVTVPNSVAVDMGSDVK